MNGFQSLTRVVSQLGGGGGGRPWHSLESSSENGVRRGKEKTRKKTPFFGPRRHMLRESRIPDRIEKGWQMQGPPHSP